MAQEKERKKRKSFIYRLIRFLAWMLVTIIILLFLLLLFIRSPWGQDIIVQRAVKFVSDKTHTEVAIEKLFITIDGNIYLKGLYLEDEVGDTLVYSKSLEVDVPLIPIIKGDGIAVKSIDWQGVKAKVVQKDTLKGYNFQFLIDAFVTKTDEDEVVIEDKEPDVDSEPLKLRIDNILLRDFDLVYDDVATGIDSKLRFGELEVNLDKIDLEKMDFHVASTYFSDAYIRLKQSATVEKSQEESDTPLPYLVVDKLDLKNIIFEYESTETDMKANLDLGKLFLKLPKADLANNDIFIDLLELSHTTADIRTYTNKEEKTVELDNKSQEESFVWPEFIFAISEINMKENNFSYVVDDAKVKNNIFNANALYISDFNFRANDVFLKDETAGIQLKELRFKEESGLNLKELHLDIAASDKGISLDNLKLHLNNNRITGKTNIAYSSLANFIEKPETAQLALNLPNFQLDVRDAFRFQPSLRNNEQILALSRNQVRGSLNASGGLANLKIPRASISWGNTKLNAIANLTHVTDIDKLTFDVKEFNAITKKEDIVLFIDEEDLDIELPQDIALVGVAKGNTKSMEVDAELTTSQGIAVAKGYWINEDKINFSADIEIKEYKLNELLRNDKFGSLSFKLTTEGSGDDINHLDVDLDANLIHFSYSDYPIDDLVLSAKIEDGEGNLTSVYKDKNLDFDLNSFVVFDSISPQANLHFNLKGANLQKLGLLDRDIRTAFVFDADFDGNRENYDIIATIGDGVFVHDDRTYLLGDVLATAHVEPDTTSIWFDNKIARLQLESNATPERFATSVKEHILGYFSRRRPKIFKDVNPVKMYVKGAINEDPLLNRILLMKVEKLDTVKIDVDYDEAHRRLIADVSAPLINYDGNELRNLKFNMDAVQEDFDFDLGFDKVSAGPFNLPKTKIEGKQINKDLHLNFNATHKDEIFVSLPWIISGTAEELKLHVPAEDIILNGEKWNTPIDNEVVLSNQKLTFHNFEFTKGNEAVRYLNDLIDTDKDQVAIAFENFNLNEILNYLNPEEEIAKGDLKGSLAMVNPFDSPGLLADLGITNLHFMDVDLGTLTLDAKALALDKYDFSLALKEGMIDLDLDGDYTTSGESPEMDLTLDINEFKVEALNGLSFGEIRDGKGTLSGKFDFSGPLNDLEYHGGIDFANVGFTVSKFNAPFSLINTSLKADNKGLYFDNFTIYDEDKNDLVVNGTIFTEDFSNPGFDLKVISDNFHIINASEDDNDFVYGKAAFDMDMDIKGDMLFPVVRMNVNISNDTDVTYIMSTAQAAIESREGVIEFVNREDPDAVLTSKDKNAGPKGVSGLDFSATLKIRKDAKLRIILDKNTGDNFQAYGDGEFEFSMKPNGSMVLSGVYEVAGGHYEMNLYNLVNRRFELVEGGRITWSGDIMDADLDVKARYQVDASASALMAPVSSGSDPATQNKFRQVLPFLVYLNIGGELMQPEISFNLDMPEDKQGAIGGQVFGRVQQLNQQEDELNRQVFSLLVMNRFFPDSGSDGSEGGFASIVRNNINDAISDQLNAFSDKLLGSTGVELDFGLDSYTDYQGDSPEERTQLDIAAQKKLFNDRLIVRVGSEVDLQGGTASTGEYTPIIGNVSLEYLLTPNGRYSLRGFRKNTFDNIIDGQLVVSGISLIFNQEFNEFRELWEAVMRGETRKERTERKAKERAEKEKERKKKELEELELQNNTED